MTLKAEAELLQAKAVFQGSGSIPIETSQTE